MTYNSKLKGVSYTVKYWFALGYHDYMNGVDNPPGLVEHEYFLEKLNVNIINEYNHGRKIAQRDKINEKR